MADDFKSCSVTGCNGNAHRLAYGRRGYCSAHYQRLLCHGDAAHGRPLNGTPMNWLLSHSAHVGDACLIWPFSRDRYGYGQVRYEGRLEGAHRLMCAIAQGAAPSLEHQAAHSCGRGHNGCVHPKHLRWATLEENKADMIDHGTVMRGEENGQAKLTEDQVREILSARGSVSQLALARQFSVSPRTIRRIHNNEAWAWLS